MMPWVAFKPGPLCVNIYECRLLKSRGVKGNTDRSQTKFAFRFLIVLEFLCRSLHALFTLRDDLVSSFVVGSLVAFPPTARQYHNNC